MKKRLISVLGMIIALSMAGCTGSQGGNLEELHTDTEIDRTKVSAKDYKDNLEGLEKYLTELDYLPEKAEPTEMMYSVIGAVDGDRYNFKVDSVPVYVELYEYTPESLNDEAKRVFSEVKKDGKFYVFDNTDDADRASYEAALSYNQKYLIIYTDSSDSEKNQQRKKDVINAVKEFYQA